MASSNNPKLNRDSQDPYNLEYSADSQRWDYPLSLNTDPAAPGLSLGLGLGSDSGLPQAKLRVPAVNGHQDEAPTEAPKDTQEAKHPSSGSRKRKREDHVSEEAGQIVLDNDKKLAIVSAIVELERIAKAQLNEAKKVNVPTATKKPARSRKGTPKSAPKKFIADYSLIQNVISSQESILEQIQILKDLLAQNKRQKIKKDGMLPVLPEPEPEEQGSTANGHSHSGTAKPENPAEETALLSFQAGANGLYGLPGSPTLFGMGSGDAAAASAALEFEPKKFEL